MVERTLTPTVLDVLSVACADFENGTRTAAQMLALDPDYVAKCAIVDAYRTGGGGGGANGVVGSPLETSTSNVGPWDINLPAASGGDGTGDLLLIFGHTVYPPTINVTITGFTALADIALSGQDNNCFLAYRVCDGSETSVVSASADGNTTHVFLAYRIRRDAVSAPEFTSGAAALSATADAPVLTPSWGLKETLWFHVIWSATQVSWSVPTGYGDEYEAFYDFPISYHQEATLVSYKIATATSDDPDSVTTGAGTWRVATTAAVQLEA